MKTEKKGAATRAFLITLALLILCSVVNWGVISGWGNVKITRLTLAGSDGKPYSALLYVPKNATDKTPAPALVCYHGNAGNARNHESWAVEFSRRGFVVLSIDYLGSGNSGNAVGAADPPELIAPAELYYNYILSMPVVDKDNIIVSGHSMGNAPAGAIGAKYNAKAIMFASLDQHPVNTLLDFMHKNEEYTLPYREAFEKYQGNILTITGTVEPIEKGRDNQMIADAMLEILDDRTGYENETNYTLDHLYGSFEEGNAFITVMETHRIHEAAFVSSKSIGHLLWFAQEALGDAVPNFIDANDQIWQFKDFTGLAGMFAFAAFVCCLAIFLTEKIPFFAEVKQPLPRNIGLRKVGLIISTICGIIFPYIALKTAGFGIINIRGGTGFRLTYANYALAIVVGISLLGIVTLILFLLTDGRKQKAQLCDLGLTPAGSNKFKISFIIKSFLLAMITVAIGWAYIQLQETVLGTDFYGWFFGIKPIPIFKIQYYPSYILIWIACFILSAIGMNVERRLPSTGREALDTLIAIVFNVLIACFTITLVVIVKWELQSNGVFQNSFWEVFGLDTNRLWGMPAGMAIGAAGSTYIFRKTGNTWLCAFLMGTVCSLMCVLYGQLRIS